MKERRSRPKAYDILGVLCLGLLIIVLFRARSSQEGESTGSSGNVTERKETAEATADAAPLAGRETIREAPTPAVEPVPIKRMRGRLMKEFERMENIRTKRIARRTRQTADGPVDAYLLGIDPPDAVQIAEARALISRAMAEVETAAREDLDEWIEEEVQSYDLLGALGKRAAIVTVPHDSAGKGSATTFTTKDYEAELTMLEHPEGSYTLHDYRGYSASAGQKLGRFSAVIEAWNRDDAAPADRAASDPPH